MSPMDLAEKGTESVEELEAMRWVLDQLRAGEPLPVVDAEAIAHALYLDMRTTSKTVLRLRPLREMAEYSAVHALNVSMLAMRVAEQLGLGREEVLAIGLAGLLHDIGMVRVPADLTSKAEQLDATERELIRTHPVEGARIILEAETSLELAAVVAYEHHLRFDGGGYPALSYKRMPHRISRLIQVCDTYHALRTPRPFRDPWPNEVIFSFLHQRAGSDFDPEMVTTLINVTRDLTL